MSDTLNLAMQITAVDMFSGVLGKFRRRIHNIGGDAKKVQRDYDNMTRHITDGLKALAVSAYTINKIRPGVSAAGDLQEAMLGVKQGLAGSASGAADLARKMSEVRRTAVEVSSNLPFSAEDVVRIENSLIKSGLELKSITGKSGAAFSAAALAALTKQAPDQIGKALANIGSQFSFSGSDFRAASDWMVRVSSAAATSVPELLQGLRMSGSAANALGINFQDTATALATLAPLGDMAGSSYSRFLAGVKGGSPQAIKLMGQLKLNFFEHGKFVGMDEAIKRLRTAMNKIPDDQKRMIALQRIFGEEGQRAAMAFLNAKKGFNEIEASGRGALSMAQKLAIWGSGFNASMEKLGGTAKSTLATLFDPMLGPLREAVDGMNALVGGLGAFAEKHRSVSQTLSFGLGVLALGAGAYATYKLARGGFSGAKVLKAVLGKGGASSAASTAAGIAKGKAVEAATGVKSVFVTNWPDNIGGSSTAEVASEAAAAAAGGGLLAKIKDLGKSALSKGRGLLGFAGMTSTAAVTASGAAGYGIGSLLNKYLIDGTGFGNSIGKGLNSVAAFFGSQESKDALAVTSRSSATQVGGTLHIKIDSEGRPRVQQLEKRGAMDLNVDTGLIPVGS